MRAGSAALCSSGRLAALDSSGRVASLSLLRSSGEADLDAKGLAVVSRAGPFPPPPPGAKRSFAIEVAFGMEK